MRSQPCWSSSRIGWRPGRSGTSRFTGVSGSIAGKRKSRIICCDVHRMRSQHNFFLLFNLCLWLVFRCAVALRMRVYGKSCEVVILWTISKMRGRIFVLTEEEPCARKWLYCVPPIQSLRQWLSNHKIELFKYYYNSNKLLTNRLQKWSQPMITASTKLILPPSLAIGWNSTFFR